MRIHLNFIDFLFLYRLNINLINIQFMIKKSLQKISYSFSNRIDKYGLRKFLQGEIPESLKFDRPCKYTKLPNNIVVATQSQSNYISTISVFIKCGSRNQTEQSSGTAHFLQHLHFKGTNKRSRNQLQLQVENMGGNLNAYTSRQNTCYMMTVFNQDVTKAVDIIGDMITGSLYKSSDVQNQRSTIYRQLLQTQRSGPMETTIQIAHRGAYRDHQMALPILGHIHNMRTISRDMILKYHNQNYTGENIIVVGSGPIQHERLVQDVQKYIKVKSTSQNQNKNAKKPIFQEGILALQSQLTDKINVAAIFQAPSYFDQDFFSYLLLQRIIGDKPQTQLEKLAMKNLSNYRFQNLISNYDSIIKQKGFFSSYMDTGLYGNYFLCEPEKLGDIIKIMREGYELYAQKITDEELQKSKRRVYVEILQHQNQNDLSQSLGNNLMYYDRRVCRKQLAERISCITSEDIQKVVKKITTENKLQLTVWGNVNKTRINGRKLG